MGTFLSVLGSVFTGGLTGIFSAGIQRFFDFLHVKQELAMKKVDHEHEIAMRRVDGELMAQEWAQRTKVAEVEAAGKEAVADAGAFAASFAMEPKQYSARVKTGPVTGFMLVLLDFIRGIIRPGLTVYLCAITTMVYLEAKAVVVMLGKTLDPVAAMDTYTLIINTILYLTTTCVLHWFGTRNKQKAPGAK